MAKRKELGDAIEESQRVLEKHRSQRKELIQALMADQHPSGSARQKKPVNLLEVARNTYTQEIMPGDLRALVTARNPLAAATARGLERGTNERIVETKATKAVEDAVNESMLSYGVVRVSEETTGPVDVPGLGTLQTSATAVRHIQAPRFFYDTNAETWAGLRFAGDIFTVPLKWAHKFDGFSRTARLKLEPLKLSEVISPDGVAKSTTGSAEKDTYLPQTQLYTVWLPQEGDSGKIVTLAPKTWEVLSKEDGVNWDGPEGGPYHFLGYNDIPGEIEPIAPLELLSSMNSLVNTAMVKIKGRVERSKEVGLVPLDDKELVDKLKDAHDGQYFTYQGGGDPARMFRMGNIGGELVAIMMQARNLFSWLGGGIEILGGLRAMSETLGQDRILARAASKRLRAMAKRVEEFARNIVRAIAWYEWTDPIRERVFLERIQQRGITYEVPLAWTPGTRADGNFLDHDVQIDVYALQHRSPEERASSLVQSIGWLAPFIPLHQQQGGTMDVAGLVRLLAKYRDQHELNEIFRTTTRRQTPIELKPPPEATPRPRANQPGRNGDEELVARLMSQSRNPEQAEGEM